MYVSDRLMFDCLHMLQECDDVDWPLSLVYAVIHCHMMHSLYFLHLNIGVLIFISHDANCKVLQTRAVLNAIIHAFCF